MLTILRYSTKHANFRAFWGRRYSTPLKQIVQETKKRKRNGIGILVVLINNLRTAWPTLKF